MYFMFMANQENARKLSDAQYMHPAQSATSDAMPVCNRQVTKPIIGKAIATAHKRSVYLPRHLK